jgi:predicted dehydrogenase
MTTIRVGIVGLGAVADAHLRTFASIPGVEIAAICSRRSLDPDDIERRFGVRPRLHRDYAALLADPGVDLVDLCTPHHLHAGQAVAGAAARKHLYIEKPVALCYEDLRRVRAAVDASGVRACVGFECRFSPHVSLIRAILDQGLIGEVHYAEVDYFHGIGPWYGQFAWNIRRDQGGSSLLTAGCHALDALLYFMEGPVLEVTSASTRSQSPIFAPYEYPTTSLTLLRFGNGALGKVASSIDCLQPYQFRIHIVGSEGSILDDRWFSVKLPGLRRDRWSRLETFPIDSGDVHAHPYRPQFEAFIDAIRTGREMPRTGIDAAFETHRVIFAADRSAELGRPVRVAELD